MYCPPFYAALVFCAVAVKAYPDPRDWGKNWYKFYDHGDQLVGGGFNVVSDHAQNACKGWNGNRGFYQDMYFKSWGQSPYTSKLCVNLVEGVHINFEIGNLNPTASFTLNPRDCSGHFESIIRGSSYGGEVQTSGWYYRVDYNPGNC